MELLPDDILASVLAGLPPSSLAASRCVCKRWCSIIDARRLLLPHRLDGFFINPSDFETWPSFFACPSTKRRIPGGRLHFCYKEGDFPDLFIEDHCNGLLLVYDAVVNPATRQQAELPPFPASILPMIETIPMVEDDFFERYYLVYDPMVSPRHFEVFLIPLLNSRGRPSYMGQDLLEWPPSPYTTHVFSSRKWRWEERSFVRRGEAAGTIADMKRCDSDIMRGRQAVYFRGALYVHCQNDSIMRIALSDDTYQMIKWPAARTKLGGYSLSYIGKSEKGVYSALLHWHDMCPKFQVWLLNSQMEWVSKSNINLQAVVENVHGDFAIRYGRPWTVHNEEGPDAQDEPDEWDFDNGIVFEAMDNRDNETNRTFPIVFLGFHPYKEIAFFCASSRVVSYHLNSSKIQKLGSLRATEQESSFPYTACWIGKLFQKI